MSRSGGAEGAERAAAPVVVGAVAAPPPAVAPLVAAPLTVKPRLPPRETGTDGLMGRLPFDLPPESSSVSDASGPPPWITRLEIGGHLTSRYQR